MASAVRGVAAPGEGAADLLDIAPWFRRRPGLTGAVAVALYAVVLGLRLAVQSPADPITLLFCLPIALLAVAFGLRAGVLAGLAGLFLLALWALLDHPSLSLLGWATLAVPMLLLGGLLGDAVDRLRRSQETRRELEAAAQRHRDAVEFNDGVVQGLSAAKWALEAGRAGRGLEIIDETLGAAQELVSGLLRDAGMGPGGQRGRSSGPTEWPGRRDLGPALEPVTRTR